MKTTTLTEDQFAHACQVALEYGTPAGYQVLRDYLTAERADVADSVSGSTPARRDPDQSGSTRAFPGLTEPVVRREVPLTDIHGVVAGQPVSAESMDAAPGVYCYGGCGRRYENFGLDNSLPTPLWNRIATGPPFDESYAAGEREGRGGVLCAQCVVDRLSKLPGASIVYMGVDLPEYGISDKILQEQGYRQQAEQRADALQRELDALKAQKGL